MTLDEFIKELQEWQINGMGQLPIFFREYDSENDRVYYDSSINNRELTQIKDKLIFV